MSTECFFRNPLRRDGTSQRQRAPKALDPAYARIDERTLGDLVRYAGEYAELLRYYTASNSPGGDWVDFVETDVTAMVALIGGVDRKASREGFQQRVESVKKAPAVAVLGAYAELFDPILTIARAIDRWHGGLAQDLDVWRELDRLIRASLNDALREALVMSLRVNELDPSIGAIGPEVSTLSGAWEMSSVEPDRRLFKGGSPVNGDDREDALRRIGGVFDRFHETQVVLQTKAESFLLQTLEDYPRHAPHMALFLAFLRLYSHAQDHLNSLGGKHLDFYYERVLRLHRKPANPDDAHVVFELAKNAEPHLLKTGTGLNGGKDDSGVLRMYEIVDEIVVNRAVIDKDHGLKTVFVETVQPDPNDESTREVVNLFAAPDADSADGLGADLEDEDGKWATFGSGSLPFVELGFAIASPMFVLSEGTRKLWSYHDHEGDAGPHDHQQDKTDLAFNDYNRSSLIRIEGHLHDKCSEAHRAIIDERHLHNAEFDVLMTNFENPVPQLDDVTNRLMALLADRQKAADAYNHVVALGVANRRFPQAELRSIRDEIERLETEIRRRVGEWVLLRGRRQLHCDISHLQTIYVDLRAELICLWGGLVVELDKISDEIRAVDGALPHGRGELAAEILDLLRQQVRWLADVWLPRRLSGFNYPVFVHRYKGLIHDLTRFWLLWRSFGFPVGDPAEEGHEIPTPWPPGAEAISSVLLSITRGCFHTRLARPFFAFKKLWEEDPSFFPNLAKSVDGLEHIAGVRRCGTFVVVCDQTAGQRIVRADFSLSCRLPCCCDADIDVLCLPPVALAGHRVVSREVRDDGRLEPVEIEIDLSNAGYEPNFEFKEGGPEDPPLRVKVEPAATAHGGKVEFDESRQVVRYIHEGPQPGLIDEFEYTLVSSHDECPGEDVGKFSILMEPKLKPVEPPEPIETTNTVYGIVTIRTETFTEVGGLVYVREDPANPIPIGSGPAGEMGFYESRQLPVGTYHLVARYEDYISAEVEIEIKAEPKTAQNLNLEQKTGRVRIRVVNRFDQPISASRITMARHDDERVRLVSNTPDPQGVHDFSVVLPGAYLVEASAPGSYEPRTLSPDNSRRGRLQ